MVTKLPKLVWIAAVLSTVVDLRADWLTFGHDPQRSAWAAEETRLSPTSAPNLELKWSVQLDNVPLALNALTAPVIARDVVTTSGLKSIAYVGGSSNHLFAVDTASGGLVWQYTFRSYVNAKAEAYFLCPNAMNATPVIDRQQNLIFSLAVDGRVFGLDLGTGALRLGPFQLTPPYSKAWSLNLDHGFLYTTTSQNCGGDRSGIYSMEVGDSLHRVTYEAVMRKGSGAGMWLRGGTAIGADGKLFVSTGDGDFRPETGEFGSSFLATSTPDLRVADYYTPVNQGEINKKDLDLPSGGLLWFAYRNYHLIAGGGKESVVYLLNADRLGDQDHQTPLSVAPQMGNASKGLEQKGIWGALALWKDETGQPWLYVPLWGETPKSGVAKHGSVFGYKVEIDEAGKPCLKLKWISPDVNLPDAPAVANGVVFVLATGENARQVKEERTQFKSEQDWKQNLLTTEERAAGTQPAELMALDAKTGKLLYRSGTVMKSWNHFGGLGIDDGRIYAVDHSSRLYCFGIRER